MTDATRSTIFTYKPDGHLWTEDGPWVSDTVTYDYNGESKAVVSECNNPETQPGPRPI